MKRRPGSMATYTSLCIYRITKLSSSRVALRMEARLRNAKDQRRSGYGDAASSRHEGAARAEILFLLFFLGCACATRQNVTSQSCRGDRSRSGNTIHRLPFSASQR
ncbi:hypothetical protein IF2G_11135 [Cordyceps javanica]|nr:hypothetical protein IF2G_11135 [Cordyceps javanica]